MISVGKGEGITTTTNWSGSKGFQEASGRIRNEATQGTTLKLPNFFEYFLNSSSIYRMSVNALKSKSRKHDNVFLPKSHKTEP